ncbi:twin-arginine translocase TatA/TatE family subunit [Parvibaculum sedimenti]|uniref:Sec-independent protein translocase protein TatA n=1 Tax=Parvibaculum sedimenti TaxID=2608632 RepID=A0A6N6VHZ9_9HYPH|nr:twin-arginine translocase TatA/TatE family subunit [Parvibaculum sedimenti]KAB7739634.1 twin-arginine translocase TatA/TatE family subunit [Parvibaculum sedimenti]
MLSWTHIIVVAALVVLLFGRGKVSDLMGDVAKGIKSFKKGLAEDDTPPPARPTDAKIIEGTVTEGSASEAKDKVANG